MYKDAFHCKLELYVSVPICKSDPLITYRMCSHLPRKCPSFKLHNDLNWIN